jgi:hypothetical protein
VVWEGSSRELRLPPIPINVTSASFDSLTGTLKVAATTSDLSVPAPALVVAGPLGGAMTAGAYSAVLPAGVLPPLKVTVNSAAGGTDTDDVVILPGLPMNKPGAPVAVADAATTNENTAITLAVTANDAVVAPAVVGSVVIVTPPAGGTAVPTATVGPSSARRTGSGRRCSTPPPPVTSGAPRGGG